MSYSLVTGAINGRLSDFFGKLNQLHQKQGFAFAVVAGNLFADVDKATETDNDAIVKLLDGKLEINVPTYFALGDRPLPAAVIEKLEANNGELCPNLTILGRKFSVKTSEGFRLVAIGGRHITEAGDGAITDYSPTFTDADAQAAGKGIEESDILVTTSWPSHIQDGARTRYSGLQPQARDCVSELCAAIKPKYHFSASESFYEREPFFHDGPAPRKITRFISLAPFGNAAKQKWIYAFQLKPAASAPDSLPPGCTASPFLQSRKRRSPDTDEPKNFRYANGNGNQHNRYNDRPHHRRRTRYRQDQRPIGPEQCFFCFVSQNFSAHMVVSIGSKAYVTTAKGPLTTSDRFPELGIPGPILIIPMSHSKTWSVMDGEDRTETGLEMHRYREALQTMIHSRSRDESGKAKLGSVTWEIVRNEGVHLHWQMQPVPVEMIEKGLVEAAFDVEAENVDYPKFAKKASEMEDMQEGSYFKVVIASEAWRKEMVMSLDGDFNFDLQFGRKVMAKLMGLGGRTHWKDCEQPKEEEEADVKKFQEAFAEFGSEF